MRLFATLLILAIVACTATWLPADAPTAPAKKPKIVLVSGSVEYQSDDSLAAFAKLLDAKGYETKLLVRKTDSDLPGLEALADADLAVFFTRRLTIDGEQLQHVQKYAASGKPIIGIRTASHGFQKWLAMDKEVYGGDYSNHAKHGLPCEITIEPKAKDSPLLKGVTPMQVTSGLYLNRMPAADITVLLNGSIPKQTMPVAWTRVRKEGGKVFYTSLGHPDDFGQASFRTLLFNAVEWSLAK